MSPSPLQQSSAGEPGPLLSWRGRGQCDVSSPGVDDAGARIACQDVQCLGQFLDVIGQLDQAVHQAVHQAGVFTELLEAFREYCTDGDTGQLGLLTRRPQFHNVPGGESVCRQPLVVNSADQGELRITTRCSLCCRNYRQDTSLKSCTPSRKDPSLWRPCKHPGPS